MCGCGPGRTCDGLECLCRPRYSAGQLLTDEDLRRLDHYIVAKNRLHNRYLHGTGVVCGLEVACNPCDPTVTVRTGFAIGPCGEDIVVCADTAVDVAELIRAQRKARADDCVPYGGRPAVDCEAARQRWILAICYEERPSRGITSLRQKEWTSCGCSCAKCGGNGNGNGNGHGTTVTNTDVCSCRQHHTMPAQCEPTVTCEGYSFKVYKEPLPTRTPVGATALANSEIGRRVQACLQELVLGMQKLPPQPTPAILVEYCCQLKNNLRDIIETANVHDCLLGMRVSDIVCPDVNDPDASTKALQSIRQLLQVGVDLYRDCVCSALLPPCPVDSPDDCVPLATLTVRTADLRVLEICNWDARHFAITFPTLGYWLGWLPVFDALRNAVTRLCCAPPRRPEFEVDERLRVRPAAFAFGAGPGPAPGEPEAPEEGVRPEEARGGKSMFSDLVAHYARHATPLSGLEATVLAALGGQTPNDEPLVVPAEMQDPFAALALARLAGPMLDLAVPPPVSALFGNVVRGEPADERVARLEETITDLQSTVQEQARAIASLRRRRNQ
jgi:hypothetical protein